MVIQKCKASVAIQSNRHKRVKKMNERSRQTGIEHRGISRRHALIMGSSSLLALSVPLSGAAATGNRPAATLDNGRLRIEFDHDMRSRIISRLGGERALTDFDTGEYLLLADGSRLDRFRYVDMKTMPLRGPQGGGMRHSLRGVSDGKLEKTLTVTQLDSHPALAILQVEYANLGDAPLAVAGWVNGAHLLKPDPTHGADYWSFNGASFADRRDWLQPAKPGFNQRNFMGMNSSDYGGGTPVLDVWRRDGGLAVGHLEATPKLVSLPLTVGEDGAHMAVGFDYAEKEPLILAPGGRLKTIETFIAIHQRDHYATLRTYREIMALRGMGQAPVPDSAYEPIWCAWGYERDVTMEDIVGALPKARELGLKWAVIDDGWQTAEGDWYLDPKKFPNGDADMKGLVQRIKAAGMRPKLWLAPLAVDPGTDLLHDHTDMLLLDKDGAVQDVTWWNSFYLCPAYEKTVENGKALVRKIMQDWGYEGLKIDGQHLNGVAPCYNPAHNHAHPWESVEKLQDYWKAIYDTAIAINPDAVVEICPCGTSYAFHNMPYMNQAVGSDPLSSWQVRLKGKSVKALMGESAAYCGDHVELADKGEDFASSIGIGAVIATKFTWPPVATEPAAKFALTPERERQWRRWTDIYQDKMLPKGTYRGELYDIGFDKPEAHAVEKEGRLFYAFYAADWKGAVELRGLTPGKTYRLHDYWNDRPLGTATAAHNRVEAAFQDFLLIEAIPT